MKKRSRNYIRDDVQYLLKQYSKNNSALTLNEQFINQGWVEALGYVSSIIEREEQCETIYISRKMLDYWLGEEDPKNVILEIANSIFEKDKYSPDVLHSDIIQSWIAK